MSTSLYWKPLPEEPKERSLYSLKWALAKKLGEYDGSVSEDLGIVDSSFIPFLEGIAAAGDKDTATDAESLIDAIKKHGKVQLVIH